MHRMTLILALAFLACSVTVAGGQGVDPPDVNAPLGAQRSDNGLFSLSLRPGLEPMRLNSLHHWALQLRDAHGRSISGATFEVDGGMPGHGHGLPTSPRVSAGAEPGHYVLRGMRFNMSGVWELRLDIRAGERSDRVQLLFVVTDSTGR